MEDLSNEKKELLQTVSGDITVCNTTPIKLYAGPRISTINNQVALIGRPHIVFNNPKEILEGIFQVRSADDELCIAIGCPPAYMCTYKAIPDCGLILSVDSNDVRVRSKPHDVDDSDNPLIVKESFPSSFSFEKDTKLHFKVDLRESTNNKVTFTVTELLEEDKEGKRVSVESEVSPENTQGENCVVFNREEGRLGILLSLKVDGEERIDALRNLADSEDKPEVPGVLQSQVDAEFRLSVDINPGMEYQTVDTSDG
mmetsp:Transcript_16651/g.25057  ORF Transcript_16651/g.25057 Transcript_16651/m.25057 type:complete len:256 (-) Transcript_16651:118-885(-)|eukprot:CAMPEP_0185036450 /NCGR_PEP_ID=MMETSP1103-20130426/29474_1 /TAXON_ID=36769 /ORGANISM="Paraphysomonas bandaiensis, Strain Caron Lab Isolate" /LENGTH=255 /DNA_ID=CAMNT_0027573991 /DNA_START=61 /DNA_END=828 /DNA_ORIENTATION=-